MPAATATEWLTAVAIGSGAMTVVALPVLSLDHDFSPVIRLLLVPVHATAGAAERAGARVRLELAALLRLVAGHLAPKEATR